MAWNEAVITTAGMNLLAKCLTEGNIVITRAVGGESCSAASSLLELNSINEPCHELNLFRLENDGGKIVVNLRVQNKGLEEEYTLRQIGLFARLEDDDGDVLFAVIQDGTGEVIPKESDNPEFLTEFDFVIPVANTDKIEVEITPDTFATAEDFAEVKGEVAELISHIADNVRHIPTGGAANQILTHSASGTAAWSGICNAAAIDVVRGSRTDIYSVTIVPYKEGRTKALIIAYPSKAEAGYTAYEMGLITGMSSSMDINVPDAHGNIRFSDKQVLAYGTTDTGSVMIAGYIGSYCVIWFN